MVARALQALVSIYLFNHIDWPTSTMPFSVPGLEESSTECQNGPMAGTSFKFPGHHEPIYGHQRYTSRSWCFVSVAINSGECWGLNILVLFLCGQNFTKGTEKPCGQKFISKGKGTTVETVRYHGCWNIQLCTLRRTHFTLKLITS